MGRRNGAGARVVPSPASCSSYAAATFTPVVPIDDGGKQEREALRPACATNARFPAPADGPGYGSHLPSHPASVAVVAPAQASCARCGLRNSLRCGKRTPGDDTLCAAGSLSTWTALRMTLEVQHSLGRRCPVICAVAWRTLLHELASNLQVRRSTARPPRGDQSSELPSRRPKMANH